jgi:hypothetical protein
LRTFHSTFEFSAPSLFKEAGRRLKWIPSFKKIVEPVKIGALAQNAEHSGTIFMVAMKGESIWSAGDKTREGNGCAFSVTYHRSLRLSICPGITLYFIVKRDRTSPGLQLI